MTPILYALLAFAGQADAVSAPDECADPQTQAAMNACAAEEFAEADKVLNAVWKDAVDYVREGDRHRQDWDKRPSGERKLRAAQRSWIGFRDAHCTVESYQARGGTMEPLLYESCRAEVTRQRTAQLRALMVQQ
jgi:uncharacterized protein YecT (DUF1311 family)